MDKRHYNRYKSLIEKLSYEYKGYNLKHLLPGYFTFAFDDNPLVARDVFKEFYLSTQLFDLNKVLENELPTFITYLINRSDYHDLAIAAQKSYPDSKVINIESLPKKKISPFSISFIRNFFTAFGIVFFRSIKESLMTKLYLVGLIIKILNYINLVEKAKVPPSVCRYICFNTAYKEESLLTLYFKKRGIETITMQHGIFCDFKLVIPFDCINLDNLIADKVLCWGQSTVDYLLTKGFNSSQLILMGNPKYKNTEIDYIDQSFTKCLVLLGRQVYISSNNKLLELLKEYNQKHGNKILFYIKKHPFLMDHDHKSYASIADNMIFIGKEHSVQEILRSELVNFSIAVNTTAYYESLALGKISLRWSESENEEFLGMDDKFYNLQDFESKIEEFENKPQAEVKEKMKEVIKYVFNPDLQ
jgi:hypothetical protein